MFQSFNLTKSLTILVMLVSCSSFKSFNYGETVFLFTGDAGEMIEENLCDFDIDSDVLKVGHHGSETSSSDQFIQKVSPEIAVISCGENNSYGHPDKITLDTLIKYDADIYRTDESGTIIVTADQNKKISVDKKASTIKENAPPESTQNDDVTAENAEVVYITNTGECYHKGTCSYLKSKIETTKEEAQIIGLRPCSKCYPIK